MALGAGRAALGVLQRWARARGFISRPVLIMGAGVVGVQVARRLENHPEYGLAPIGFLDEDPRSVVKVGGRDVPVLGKIEDLDAIVERTGVHNLIVAFSSVAETRVSRLIRRCQELGIEVSVVPRMFDTINNRVGYDTVGGLPLMPFTTVDPRGVQFAIKQSLDRVLALALLVMLSPVILFSAFAVRLSSTGPVLFRQRRIGRDGKVFDLYKFRSMRIADGHVDPMDDDADPLEFPLPSGGVVDDRPTPIEQARLQRALGCCWLGLSPSCWSAWTAGSGSRTIWRRCTACVAGERGGGFPSDPRASAVLQPRQRAADVDGRLGCPG